ncbi:MAG: DMT family transporter, partial [Candidatus Omnitrophota bacterium]|nr:DMT family transporter [Candidatus Omnitrophota bacterium]
FAAISFAIVLTVRKKWLELKNTVALKDILITTLLLGIFYYLLTFFALRSTSAGNVSIIALTEILSSYLFFQVWRKDYMSAWHKIGAVFMVIGAFIVLYPSMGNFTGGEFLILIAAIIAPIGNLFAQRARKRVSSESILFIRSFITAIFGFILVFLSKSVFSYTDIKSSLVLILINGLLLLGLSKIFWIEGIHRISVTKANALSSISPLFTLLFAWILLQNPPSVGQVLAFIPMFLGVMLLGKVNKNKS